MCRDVVILVSLIALELAEFDALNVVLEEVVVVLCIICSNEQHMHVRTVGCFEVGKAKGDFAVSSLVDGCASAGGMPGRSKTLA